MRARMMVSDSRLMCLIPVALPREMAVVGMCGCTSRSGVAKIREPIYGLWFHGRLNGTDHEICQWKHYFLNAGFLWVTARSHIQQNGRLGAAPSGTSEIIPPDVRPTSASFLKPIVQHVLL